MICNRITQPEFTKEQIAECEKCKHASGKKIWCCNPRIGTWIKEPERNRIIIPSRKIQYPSKLKQASSFTKAAIKQAKAGNPKRNDIELARVRAICESNKCGNYVAETKVGPRCIICGCCLRLKDRWKTAHCEMGLW